MTRRSQKESALSGPFAFPPRFVVLDIPVVSVPSPLMVVLLLMLLLMMVLLQELSVAIILPEAVVAVEVLLLRF